MTDPNQAAASATLLDEREAKLPPMSPRVLAAYRRMWREPDLLAQYEPGTWVAFAGETIVAASKKLEDVHRILNERGEADVLIVPVDPVGWFGL